MQWKNVIKVVFDAAVNRQLITRTPKTVHHESIKKDVR